MAEIRIDTSALTWTAFLLDGSSEVVDGGKTVTLPLAAGDYAYHCSTVSGPCFHFIVTPDGVVQYADEYRAFLSGAGTTTLTVSGYPVTIDGRTLSHDLNPYEVYGAPGVLARNEIHVLTLLPADSYMFQPTATGVGDFSFGLDLAGRVTVDPKYDGFATVTVAPVAMNGYRLSDDSQHVNYVGIDNHIHELFISRGAGWADNDLTAIAGAVAPAAHTALNGYPLSDDSQHVNYVGVDNHIHELFISRGAGWADNDLTAIAGAVAPAAHTAVHGHRLSDDSQHVIYVGVDNHIHELFISRGAGWADNDLTAIAGAVAPAAHTALDGYPLSDDSQHVNYVGVDNHIHELFISRGAGWADNDLTAIAGAVAPAAHTAVHGHRLSDDSQHVIYVGVDNHIHELFISRGAGWADNDLTAIAGAVAPAAHTALDGYPLSDDSQHVNYVGVDNHIHELFISRGAGWADNDLTAIAGAVAPLAPTDATVALDGYPLSDDSQHINYVGIDNHIHELFISRGAGWADNDLTTIARAVAPTDPTVTLDGYLVTVDATALSTDLQLDAWFGVTQPIAHGASVKFTLLPADDYRFILDGFTDLHFAVDPTGAVIVGQDMIDLLAVETPGGGQPPVVKVLPHETIHSPIYGLVHIKGVVYTKWLTLAGEKDANGVALPLAIGSPVEEVRTTSLASTFISQRFERGLILDVAGRNNPCAVYGSIAAHYHYLGDFDSLLGAPVADEEPAAGGGRRSRFDGGVIHWRDDTGAHETHGAILNRWRQLGGPAGALGYPVSDELPVLQGGVEIGRVSRFEPLARDGNPATVGVIYWSASTGAQEMWGPIYAAWQQDFGGPSGLLGLPTSGPAPTPTGAGQLQHFEHGFVVWTPDKGAVPITGGIVFNLVSFACDDNFNVQIDITSTVNGAPGPHNHGRSPAGGEYDSGQKDFLPYSVLLSFDTVTPDLVIRVNQMEAISENVFGKDDRKGNVAPITYNIDNLWGLDAQQQTYTNGSFTAQLAVQHNPPLDIDPTKRFRQQGFWPFENFDTDNLSWAQYESTFRDVVSVDRHVSIWPPRFHPLEIAVYALFYHSLAQGGNCFGVVLEAIYAREHRALFEEPIFTSGSYRKDGDKLIPDGGVAAPENAEVANEINVKHGYQIGNRAIWWFLQRWTSGDLHDPVKAFRESRDAYARRDWPILSLSDKDKLSTNGHAVLPYAWSPATEAEIVWPPPPGEVWTIFVANPNTPAVKPVPATTTAPATTTDGRPDNDIQCKIMIDPTLQTWSTVIGDGYGTWSGSNEEGGRLVTITYDGLLSEQPNSPADLVANLLNEIATGGLIIMAGAETQQITDTQNRTLFDNTSGGGHRVNLDPATRIPDLALIPNHAATGTPPEVYVWRPDPMTAASGLQHVTQGSDNYMWSVLSPSLSVSITRSGTGTGAGGDSITLDKLGTADQVVTHRTAASGPPAALQISVAGWSGTDRTQAKWFELNNVTTAPGHNLAVQVLEAGQTLSIHNDGPAVSFDLGAYSGLDTDPVVVRTAVQMPAAAVWRLASIDWAVGRPNSVVHVDELSHIGGTVVRQFSI